MSNLREEHCTVLVIEDEADTADLIASRLSEAGFSVIHASNGCEAVAIIERIAPPRAVLLDLIIPYVSGFDLLKTIRNKPGWEHVPVMVVSADSYAEDIDRVLSDGANDYIVKSWGFMTLYLRLERLLGQSTEKMAA